MYIYTPPPERLLTLKKKDFQIPIDLEAYYSDEIWREAQSNNWLEAVKDPINLLSNSMKDRLFKTGENAIDTLSEKDKFRICNKFSCDNKVKMCSHIEKMPDDQAKKELSSFKNLLDTILKCLSINVEPSVVDDIKNNIFA